MKVSELIEKLSEVDPDLEVRFEKSQTWLCETNWFNVGYVDPDDPEYIIDESQIIESEDDWDGYGFDKKFLRSELQKAVVLS